MSRKDIKSLLARKTLCQVHIPPSKEINHPHYDATKPTEQHQFDLLYIHHNFFEGNTYKYILTGIDAASTYKAARVLSTKKSSEVPFVLESIYKNGDVFKYLKLLQCDNGSEFKNEVTKLLEQHNVDVRSAKYLYQPGEHYGGQKRRARDFIWSKNTYRLDQIVQEQGNPVLYYLKDRPDRAFVREDLMHISEDTQVSLDWVSEWK